MRTRTRIAATVTTLALLGGVGLVSAPAQAKVTSKVSGSTAITFLPEVYNQFGVDGVQFQAFLPATSTNPSGTQTLRFPVTTPFKPGAVASTGIMAIGGFAGRIDLSLPMLEYSGTKGSTTGQITFQDDYAVLTSGRLTLFRVTDMSVKVTRGKVVKVGKAWTRTDRHRIRGSVTMVDEPSTVAGLNAYIGETTFTPGMELGTLDSTVTITTTCSSQRKCR